MSAPQVFLTTEAQKRQREIEARARIPRRRWLTYRGHEQRRRAFYKYVCKMGYYRNIRGGVRPSYPSGSHPCRYGYPLFEAARSGFRDQWEAAGNERLEDARLSVVDRERREIYARLDSNQERHSAIVRIVEGTGIAVGLIYERIGVFQFDAHLIPLELLEAQAFLLAIKSHLKRAKNEQHHRTPK